MPLRPLRAWARTADPTGGMPLDDLGAGVALERDRVRSHDGADLDLVVAGEGGGPFVVLSHCWTGDRRVWGPVARRLATSGHRVALYDQRGHGRSSIGSSGLTLDAVGGDLGAVLEHLDARGAVLGGHSLGGMAVQALAAREPALMTARVDAAVLAATACTAVARDLRRRAGPAVVGRPRVERLVGHRVLGPLAVRDFVGRRPCLSHLQAIGQTFVSTPGPVRAGLLSAMQAMELTGALGTVPIPVTVVVGEADRHTTVEHARAIVRSVPGARLVVVPDAGHMLPFEAPDLLARLLAEAVDRPPLAERNA